MIPQSDFELASIQEENMQLTPEQFQEFLDPIVGMIETECRRKGLPLSSLDSESVYFAIEDAMRRSHKWTIDQPV